MEGEWPFYRGAHFNGGSGVMLRRWLVQGRENGHVTEVVTLMGGRMFMLQGWSL